jgi:Beta-1,3-glucanase
VTITVPHLAGARLWLSVGAPLTFLLNPGPALVEPSVSNPTDPSISVMWDFCEFTYNQSQLFANISFVDFAAIPVALSLTDMSGAQHSTAGLAPGGLDTICAGLTAQAATDGHPWDDLIVTSGGRNLRALSPANGIAADPSFLAGYYDDYVSQAWAKYASTALTVDTQASIGTVSAQVSDGLLTFPGVGSFARPSAADIFSCASGPFSPAGLSPGMLAIVPRLAAALNRSTLLTDPDQPDGENPASYYAAPVTNHYARIVHAASRDGRGYAFPYDDVAPSGGADQSGSVASGSPAQLAITVGPVHA